LFGLHRVMEIWWWLLFPDPPEQFQLYVPSIATDIFPSMANAHSGRLSSRVHHSRPSMLRFC
jgi:hypothetical protein